VYSGGDGERGEQVSQLNMPAPVVSIRYHGDQVFVALGNGSIMVLAASPVADIAAATTLQLGTEPVSCLLPINSALYAACDKKVSVLCPYTAEVQVCIY